jgi:hypothetical protein
MIKLISELRKMIKNEHEYSTKDMLDKLKEIDIESKGVKAKNDSRFVEFTDDGFTTLIKRKSICKIGFRKDDFEKVYISFENGQDETFNVSENQEVIENLLADFKG